jgi:proteasome activator subunit 4
MTKPKKHIKRVKTIDLIREKTGIQDITEVPLNKARPGLRADNQWHLFDANYIDTENETTSELEKAKWESSSFLEKTYWGYYCWPNELNVPLSKRDWYVSDNLEVAQNGSSSEDSYQRAMKPIVDRFRNDSAFVSKFIQLSIIEESKGNEKFDKKRFYFFKALFRNFGCAEIIDSLFDHLSKLVADKDTLTHECSHKLAAEIMSGLIRGSKSWPLAKLKPLWVKVRPILDKLVENMSTDNVKLWYNCFSNSFEDQDPRRLVFYINYFSQLTMKMFNANKPDESVATAVADTAPIQNSFQQASCLQFLLAFNQFEWKVQSFWNGLADLFMANMNHPYKSIREKISS